jgi:hypothetical protein
MHTEGVSYFFSVSLGLGFHVCAYPKVLAPIASEASETSAPAEELLLMAIGERDLFRLVLEASCRGSC